MRVDDDDLILIDEIKEAAPRRVNIDDHLRHLDYVHGTRHRHADVDLEVDVINARSVAACDHGFTHFGPLFAGQIDGAGTAARPLALRALAIVTRVATFPAILIAAVLSFGAGVATF